MASVTDRYAAVTARAVIRSSRACIVPPRTAQVCRLEPALAAMRDGSALASTLARSCAESHFDLVDGYML